MGLLQACYHHLQHGVVFGTMLLQQLAPVDVTDRCASVAAAAAAAAAASAHSAAHGMHAPCSWQALATRLATGTLSALAAWGGLWHHAPAERQQSGCAPATLQLPARRPSAVAADAAAADAAGAPLAAAAAVRAQHVPAESLFPAAAAAFGSSQGTPSWLQSRGVSPSPYQLHSHLHQMTAAAAAAAYCPLQQNAVLWHRLQL